MPSHPPPPSDADAHLHEPIVYSGAPGVDPTGDPIDNGDGNDGRQKPAMGPRLGGLPVLFLSRGAQVYAGGAPFNDRTTIGELISREEVRAAERRALQRKEPLPDAFVFFNEARTEVKVLLWSDRGFTVVHQHLDEGAFALPRNLVPAEKIPVEELARMFCGPPRASAKGQAARAEPALQPPGLH